MTDLEKMREKLQNQINYHNILYYQKSKPEISDAEYDELKKKLAAIEPEAYATQDSVGAPPNERFSKVEHQEPMMNKV